MLLMMSRTRLCQLCVKTSCEASWQRQAAMSVLPGLCGRRVTGALPRSSGNVTLALRQRPVTTFTRSQLHVVAAHQSRGDASSSKPDPSLPPCQVLSLDQITVVESKEELALAVRKLSKARKGIGFDTESKPIFNKGQKNKGPHLMQLAVHDHAFLLRPAWFQREEVVQLLKSQTLLAFNPSDDKVLLKDNYNIDGLQTVDVGKQVKKALGIGYRIGPKQATELLMGCSYQKSKKVTMSKWAEAKLTDKQLLYAANDAWIARHVYLVLIQKQKHSQSQ